jgi:hypothetical protein
MSKKKDTDMNFLAKLSNASRTNKIIAAFVAIAVIGAGYAVLRTQAAGFFAATEPESGTVTGNAQIVSDSGASNGKAVKFLAGTTTPPTTPPPTTPPPTTPPPTTPPPTTPPPSGGSSTTCPLPAYPNDSCTGVPVGTTLTTHNGDYTARAGEVVEGKRITGELRIDGNGVVIRKSEIYGDVKNYGTNSFTIEDSLLGPPSGCSGEAALGNNNYTARRIKLRGHGEGLRIEHGNNVAVYDSYIKLCDPGGDAHSDGIQGYIGGTNVRIEHNTIDQRPVPLARVTAPIFWSDDSGGGLQVINNMFAGGGYSIRIYHFGGSNHTFSGNKLVNGSWGFGPTDSDCGKINWSNNSLVDVDSNYNITRTVGALNCS